MAVDSGQPEGLGRPAPLPKEPLPPIPDVSKDDADTASVEYSHYRTGLSRHRTGLSEHRTDLSEYRTDLSSHRTDLSEHRTKLSDHRTDLSKHRTDLSEHRTDLSKHRTGMSIERTRFSADNTLMAVIRTSLSMIGFGFTLQQTFEKLREAGTIHDASAPRNFGVSLIALGILVLCGGIWRHINFGVGLRHKRRVLLEEQLVSPDTEYPFSITLVAAILLLAIGLLAIASIAFNISPFG